MRDSLTPDFFDFVPADALDAVQLELASNPASHIPYLDSSGALRRFVSADSEILAEGGFAIGIAEARHVLRARGVEVHVVATVFKQARVHDVYVARPEGWAIIADEVAYVESERRCS